MTFKTPDTEYLVDADDFCRACGGRGGESERTVRGTYCWEPCRHCGGTGYRSVQMKRTFAAYGGQK